VGELLSPVAKPKLSVLMYHQVGMFESPRRHRACYCDVRRFRQQMSYLKRFGYRVLDLEEALQALFGDGILPPRSVVLTFDDGYRNFREHAFPILLHFGFPATVYLVSGLLGGRAEWLDVENPKPSLMTPEEIRELHREGVRFGSHGITHSRLSCIGPEAAREEIFASRQTLEDLLGEAVEHFCYPYGDYDDDVRRLVHDAGYRSALTCIRGAANEADNPLEIPRKAISYGDNLVGYAWKLHMKHARKFASRPAVS